jgi:hypothetical protein
MQQAMRTGLGGSPPFSSPYWKTQKRSFTPEEPVTNLLVAVGMVSSHHQWYFRQFISTFTMQMMQEAG